MTITDHFMLRALLTLAALGVAAVWLQTGGGL